jgi:FKBP-type peptidyl-prolyl cis-trans isomerase SlyD
MQIEKKKAVALDYTLSIDGGIIVDSSDPGEPLWYLHGGENIIPGLERALEGLKVGDEKTVVVPAADGYGEYVVDRVHHVPKESFPADSNFEIGDRVTATAPDGTALPARISAISPSEVTLDFNHELAGKELTFKVKVTEVRAATKDELTHGHVHGPGGHHH